MKCKFGSTVLAASGSIGGCTYSRNRYGPYVRSRSIPVNPNSAGQQSVRSLFATFAEQWNLTLTQAERDGWNAYAAAVAKIDSLGQSQFILGINWYIAVNTLRLRALAGELSAAPTTFNLTPLTAPSFTATAPSTLSLIFNNTEEWAIAVGGHLAVFVSRGMNPTRDFFKGPFRYTDTIDGAVVPPTSPAAATAPFAFTAGQRLYARYIACSDDGRLSVPVIVTTIAV
jgi:hypothetical protein